MRPQHTLCLIVLSAVFFSAVSANFFPAFPVTSFLWSGNKFFTDHSQCDLSLPANALADLVTKITDKDSNIEGQLWNYASKDASSPEVFLIFIEPKSQIYRQAYSFLQTTLTGSSSSVIAPYVYRDPETQAVSELLLDAFHLAPSAHRIVVSDDERLGAIRPDQLVESLKGANKDIFSNGVVDLVLVFLPVDASASEAIVTKVDEAVKSASSGDYIALFTANTEFEREKMPTHRNAREAIEEEMELRGDSNYYAERKFWPHEVWEGLLISWLLLAILAVGLYCSATLQSPNQWEKAPKVHQQ